MPSSRPSPPPNFQHFGAWRIRHCFDDGFFRALRIGPPAGYDFRARVIGDEFGAGPR